MHDTKLKKYLYQTMKKTFILILSFAFLTLPSFSQKESKNATVLLGPTIDPSNLQSRFREIIGNENDKLIVLRFKYVKNDYFEYFNVYNNNLDPSKTVANSQPDDSKNWPKRYIFQTRNNLMYFISLVNEKTKKHTLYYQEVDNKTFKYVNKRKIIKEIDFSKNKKNPGEFSVKLSQDSSKFIIIYQNPVNKDDNQPIGFLIFDEDMDLLWKKEATLPYKETDFKTEDFLVDEEGQVYIQGRITQYKKVGLSYNQVDYYNYTLLKFSQNKKEAFEYPLELDDKYISNVKITLNQKQDLICGSYYSLKPEGRNMGSYFIKFNGKTDEVMAQRHTEFDKNTMAEFLEENDGVVIKTTSIEKGIYNIKLNDIIITNDDEIYFIGEQIYTRGGEKPEIHHNDIMVIKMNSEGKIEWIKKVGKRQTTFGRETSFVSYHLSFLNDKLYFIFNDNAKNLNHTGKGRSERYYAEDSNKNTIVSLVVMDEKGTQTREKLFGYNDVNVTVMPEESKMLSKNEIILYGLGKKTERLIKVTLL